MISVAMATYNGAPYLAEQLATLAAQTRLPDELVVSDDLSTDTTVAILERFARDAPFAVKIHVNAERLGWRANFMETAGRCRGELVAFCDQDDLWYPSKLDTMAAFFDDPEVLLAFHDADLIDANGKRYATLLPRPAGPTRVAVRSRPTDWSNPLGLTLVFRAALLRYGDLWSRSVDLAVPSHRAAHDQWFYFLATNLGDVTMTRERLLAYRQHAANSVGWDSAPTPALPSRSATRDQLGRSIGMLERFVDILATAAARETGDMARRLHLAVLCNRSYLENLKLRRALYEASSFTERLRCVARLLGRRAYGQRDRWGLGTRALFADALAAASTSAGEAPVR